MTQSDIKVLQPVCHCFSIYTTTVLPWHYAVDIGTSILLNDAA